MADKKKASPDSVKAAQEYLKKQGFYYSDITGQEDEFTQAAIRRYQIRKGIGVTGSLNEETMAAMNAPQTGGSAQPQAAAPDKKKRSDYKGLSKEEAIRQFKKETHSYKMALRGTPEHKRMEAAEERLTKKGVNYNDYEVTGKKHQEALTSRDSDIAEMAKASAAWHASVPDDANNYALKEAHGVTDKEIRRLRFEAEEPDFTPDAPDAAPAVAPQDDRVSGPESRATGRGRPVIPVPAPAPDKPPAPDAPPPAQPDAANPDDMPDPDPKTGKPWTAKGLEARDKERKKLADDQAKLDARAAKDKEIESNAGKPLWTKSEEAKAKYEARHGRPPPANWISGAPTNVLADQATIPPAMKALGIYSTYSGDTDPKTGLTKPEVWDKLFKGSERQDEGWTEIEGVGRVSADGRFQQKYGSKGRWGDVTAPLYLTLDRRFGGKDWHTEKAWSGASADEKAAMIRADAGIPTPQVWITPDDTTAAIGADTAALDGTSVDRMTGRAVPAGARMFSNEYGSGFVSKLPSAQPAQGAGSQVAGPLPGITPVTPPSPDDVPKALGTKF